jgi:hypothetical protein
MIKEVNKIGKGSLDNGYLNFDNGFSNRHEKNLKNRI